MADIDELKADIGKLADRFRDSEKDIYSKIDGTNTTVGELNTSIKLVVEKLTFFIDTFKNHDENEMKKYDTIANMFDETKKEVKKLEENISNKYATKENMKEIEKKLNENNEAIKKGFKIFYIGTGIFMCLGIIGGLIMWILDLISKLQSLGVN